MQSAVAHGVKAACAFPPRSASSRCFYCLAQVWALSFIFAPVKAKLSRQPWCDLADATSKCSCILRAVGHLGYCRFQLKMRDARASSAGKGQREVTGWLAGCSSPHRSEVLLYFIYISHQALRRSLLSSPCELFIVIHKVLTSTITWTLLAHAHARNNRCIYLWKRFVASRSSFASLWLRAVTW